MTSQLRALVTGGAGFIGSHVADALLAAGYATDVLDDLSRGQRERVPAGAGFHQFDIRSADAAAVVREGGYDVVCHLAAQIDVRLSVADPVADASRNILGSLNLAEAARAAPRPPRFVFSSTGGAVYGDLAVPPSAEDEPKNPESPYGIAKLSVEYYLASFARLYGLETVALRYSNVYGPGQDPHGEAGVVAIFCGRLLDGRPLTVFGDGLQTRDYVYVGDVAAANVCAARAVLPPAGPVDARAFNVGTGVPTSVLDLAATLQRVAGVSVPVEHLPARKGEQARSFIAVDKAARALDWRPRLSLADGLARTYASFRDLRTA